MRSVYTDTVKRSKLSYFVFLENLNDWTPGLGQFDMINGCQMNTVAFRLKDRLLLKIVRIVRGIVYLLNLSSTKETPHKKKSKVG